MKESSNVIVSPNTSKNVPKMQEVDEQEAYKQEVHKRPVLLTQQVIDFLIEQYDFKSGLCDEKAFALSAMNAEIMGGDSDPYYGAPVVVLVLAEGNTFVEDGTCVLENLMLAAHAMGLATVWVHREREMFDSEKGKALLREWGLPETLRGVGAVALGYAAQEPAEAAPRKQNYIVKL